MSFLKKNKVECLVFAVLLLLSLGGMWLMQQGTPQKIATLQREGVVLAEFDLSQETSPQVFSGESGSYHLISVVDGNIAVLEANCPDQICVKQGYQNGEGGPIVCLPYELIIRFSGDNYDEVTG